MRVLVSGSQMKEIDRYTIHEIGIPSMVLMERAALAVAEQVELRCARGSAMQGSPCAESAETIETRKPSIKNGGNRPKRPAGFKCPDRIWAVCGTGNNGADGIAAARMLYLKGYRVSILLCGDPDRGTTEYRQQLEIARALAVPVIEYHDFIPGACDVIVDGIFGVGLGREVEGEYREVIEMLESRHAREVIAIDIPSGVHSDTGQVMGIALKATATVTFGYEKLGTVLYPGRSYCGDVVVADIGFPQVSYEKSLRTGGDILLPPGRWNPAPECPDKEPPYRGIQFFTYGPEDAARRPGRPADANKGTFGKVLIVAGSRNMSGAAYLSALSAYRTGAGLVKILTVEENREILQTQLPEAILETYCPWRNGTEETEEAGQKHVDEPVDGELRENTAGEAEERLDRQIAGACDWASVIVLGPGIGQEPYVKQLVKSVLIHAYVPIIIDADGLNTIAACPELTQYYTENIIITPHVGEMARLTGRSVAEIKKTPIDTVLHYSGLHGITCVLKDAVTVAAGKEGQVYLNTSGSSAMAKAGSGDVLTGAIAGLLAQGEENWEAAILGVYLHGAAGDRCLARFAPHGLLAGDITNELGAV